jgi:hypothetical protein
MLYLFTTAAELAKSRSRPTVGIMIHLDTGKKYFFPSPTTVIQGQPVPAFLGGILAEQALGRELIELPSTKIEYGLNEKGTWTCLKVLKHAITEEAPADQSVPVSPKEPTPDDYAAVAVIGKDG